MQPGKLLEILGVAERLKNTYRHSWTSSGRRESVAEHSWRLTLFAYFVCDEFPEIDGNKLIKMCLIHDLGEAFIGDIPSFEKTETDEAAEKRSIAEWLDTLPEHYRTEMISLYREMEARETTEAKIFKALDNMEAVIQHNEADLSTWIPKEYELNLTYGEDKAAFSPFLTALREAVRKDTEKKIKR